MIMDSSFITKVTVIEFIIIVIATTISKAFVLTIKELGNQDLQLMEKVMAQIHPKSVTTQIFAKSVNFIFQ